MHRAAPRAGPFARPPDDFVRARQDIWPGLGVGCEVNALLLPRPVARDQLSDQLSLQHTGPHGAKRAGAALFLRQNYGRGRRAGSKKKRRRKKGSLKFIHIIIEIIIIIIIVIIIIYRPWRARFGR
jgi:hypothetical protein